MSPCHLPPFQVKLRDLSRTRLHNRPGSHGMQRLDPTGRPDRRISRRPAPKPLRRTTPATPTPHTPHRPGPVASHNTMAHPATRPTDTRHHANHTPAKHDTAIQPAVSTPDGILDDLHLERGEYLGDGIARTAGGIPYDPITGQLLTDTDIPAPHTCQHVPDAGISL